MVLSWKARTCATSLIVTNGKYRSMSHPLLFHDVHLLPHFDDKTVHRGSVVQNSGFEFFSRITAIRKDSKNRKSGSVSLLTNYCSYCFLLSQTTLFSQQILPKRSFGESFSGAFFQKGAVLWRYCVACGLFSIRDVRMPCGMGNTSERRCGLVRS